MQLGVLTFVGKEVKFALIGSTKEGHIVVDALVTDWSSMCDEVKLSRKKGCSLASRLIILETDFRGKPFGSSGRLD